MKLTAIKEAVVRGVSMFGLKLKVATPEIMVGAGIVSLVAAGVMACVETTKKLDEIIDKHNAEMENIRQAKELAEAGEIEIDKDTGIKKATAGVYCKTVGRAIKTYAPAIALALLGITLTVCGHGLLKKRHVALVAAYTGLSESFKKYRGRVADSIGAEAEKRLFSGSEKKLITETHVGEDGNEIQKTTEQEVAKKGASCSPFTFIFDAANAPSQWSRHPGYNYDFLVNAEMTANRKLRDRGYLTLNQVLESLGMDAVQEGMTIGWFYNKGTESMTPVSFGIELLDPDDPGCFRGGLPDYVLNFNCMGPIRAALPHKKPVSYKKPGKIKAVTGRIDTRGAAAC